MAAPNAGDEILALDPERLGGDFAAAVAQHQHGVGASVGGGAAVDIQDQKSLLNPRADGQRRDIYGSRQTASGITPVFAYWYAMALRRAMRRAMGGCVPTRSA